MCLMWREGLKTRNYGRSSVPVRWSVIPNCVDSNSINTLGLIDKRFLFVPHVHKDKPVHRIDDRQMNLPIKQLLTGLSRIMVLIV